MFTSCSTFIFNNISDTKMSVTLYKILDNFMKYLTNESIMTSTISIIEESKNPKQQSCIIDVWTYGVEN